WNSCLRPVCCARRAKHTRPLLASSDASEAQHDAQKRERNRTNSKQIFPPKSAATRRGLSSSGLGEDEQQTGKMPAYAQRFYQWVITSGDAGHSPWLLLCNHHDQG